MSDGVKFEAKAEVDLEDVAEALAKSPSAMGKLMAAVSEKQERDNTHDAVSYWFEALEDASIFTFQFIAAAVTGVAPKKPERPAKAKQ